MATPTQLRSGLLGIRRLASNDLAALFRQVTNAAQARVALDDILPALIEQYGSAAAAVAADWYDDARMKADVPGSFTAIPAEVGDRGARELAAWSTSRATSLDAALSLAAGGLVRRINDLARETVMGSSIADPQARGWQRFAAGGCGFCVMLASRGAVYSQATADFASHDDCKCVAAPAFAGQPLPVQPYKPSDRRVSDADRARTRAWIKENL